VVVSLSAETNSEIKVVFITLTETMRVKVISQSFKERSRYQKATREILKHYNYKHSLLSIPFPRVLKYSSCLITV